MTTRDWTDPQAARLWQSFARDLAWRDRDLPEEDRVEAHREATAHILESLDAQEGEELQRLEDAIARFGPLPKAPPVWRKPLGVILHQLSILVIGVSGLVLLVLLHMAVMEVFDPQNVGLWIYDSGDFALSYEAQPQAREILGGWFIPLMLAITGLTAGTLYALWRTTVSDRGPLARWIRD